MPQPLLFLAAAVGYLSLSQEMLWMRAVSYMTGGRPSVFAHVLGFFLIGVALGALYAERLCRTRFAADARQPASPRRFIANALVIAGLFYYLSIGATARLLTVSESLGAAAVYLDVATVSFLLGAVFPVLCHYGANANQSVGIAVSRMYLANIVGCTLGPLLTGFVLMQYIPIDQIILFISIATIVLGFLLHITVRPSASSSNRKSKTSNLDVACFLIAVSSLFALPLLHDRIYSDLLERLHYKAQYAAESDYEHLIENRSGIVAVQHDAARNIDIIYGGGIYDGVFNTSPFSNENRIRRAYLVAGLHPNPKRVLEVGLSGGAWARVLADYPPVETMEIVEINGAYVDVIRHYPEIAELLTDPRVRIHVDDGRRWLNRHPEMKFDFMLQNTTYHWRSLATNILSEEYLRLCKSRLNPGGVIFYNTTTAWDIPYTASKVFKHVVMVEDFCAASDEPFTIAPEQVRENLLKFQRRGKPIFDPAKPEHAKLLDEMSHAVQPFIPDPDAHKRLWRITDDNMATEYKLERPLDRNRSWLAWFRSAPTAN
jgi:spermidine synthase